MTGKDTVLPDKPGSAKERSILMREYVATIAPTDRLPPEDLRPVLMGLFGEVGSVMAIAKKRYREKKSYIGFQRAVEEEFGDVMWYFSTLCRRLGYETDKILSDAASGAEYETLVTASDLVRGPIAHISIHNLSARDDVFLNFANAVAPLLQIQAASERTRRCLCEFANCYLQALQISEVSFARVIHINLEKACGRFLEPDPQALPVFDEKFTKDEQLPWEFKIYITQRKSGKSYLQWNGVFIGAPLTDNILDPDGYRFHDVFHLAHAAILHWSPVFRALIQQKRKSDPKIDEAEDGGRAIVVEEGLTAWIFARAKELNFFDDQNDVSFDLLKTVQQFVQGYEVAKCPLWQWEKAILEGYKVFLQVREQNGGIVVGDRRARTIKYQPIGGGAT